MAIKVLNIFKKQRKTNLEQRKGEETKSKRLWQRLLFKIRVFNIFTKKIDLFGKVANHLLDDEFLTVYKEFVRGLLDGK